MNQTTKEILYSIALTGNAVILTSRKRELHAALDLIADGICYRAQNHGHYFLLKFGRNVETTEEIIS